MNEWIASFGQCDLILLVVYYCMVGSRFVWWIAKVARDLKLVDESRQQYNQPVQSHKYLRAIMD